ncbi:hypothetical protein [Pseudomonas sp. S11A4]|uniref:hypothetical protein n=1 Tax=Pseudomonas sp. S11A4 TaxID=1476791 RepID=UPI00406D0EE0
MCAALLRIDSSVAPIRLETATIAAAISVNREFAHLAPREAGRKAMPRSRTSPSRADRGQI